MQIFGVRLDNLSCQEIEKKIEYFLSEEKFHRIATINPEFLLRADQDAHFRAVLNAANLNVPDGFGLHLAAWRRGERLPGRYPGANLMHFILKKAQEKQLSIFLAARADGLSTFEETRDALLKLYPQLKMSGVNITLDKLRGTSFNNYPLLTTHYHLVLCNFGASYQEYFLESLRHDPGDIRLCMGVGGTFDYLTGKIKRAPGWMRAIGLEWLWRFIQQPQRGRRIVNATLVFPWKIWRS